MAEIDLFISKLAKMDDSTEIAQFEDLGISYGFWGKDSQDPMELVELNRPKQVHENNLVESTFEGEVAGVKADGVYTSIANHRIAVVTADCLPLLMIDRNKTCAAAVHAGWRGLVAGIIGNAVEVFQAKQVDISDLHVAVGPCISAKRYEVGEDVITAVKNAADSLSSEEVQQCLLDNPTDGKANLDIAMFALMQLGTLGVKAEHISFVNSCTFDSEDLWFSYRRDGKQAGRNFSWISL